MVANTRGGGKRCLYAVKREDVMPRKRARTSNSSINFPLLDLPAEVRALVLKELLLLSEPLEFTSKSLGCGTMTQWREHYASLPPPRLFPDILYTCKQLYEEGSKILYSNAIKCRIAGPQGTTGTRSGQLMILGPSWGTEVGKLPSAILNKISRVHIELHLHYEFSCENLWEVQDTARDLSKGIRTKALNWKDISIELIHHRPIDEMDLDTDMIESLVEVLQPFMYLRKCSKVSIKGASEAYTKNLISVMTSDTNCVDLDLMLDAIDEYIEEKVPEQDDLDPTEDNAFENSVVQRLWTLYADLKIFRNDNAIDEFYKTRTMLLQCVSLYERRKRADIFKWDPEGRAPEDTEEAVKATEAIERMFRDRDICAHSATMKLQAINSIPLWALTKMTRM